jgi:hypothetical protein
MHVAPRSPQRAFAIAYHEPGRCATPTRSGHPPRGDLGAVWPRIWRNEPKLLQQNQRNDIAARRHFWRNKPNHAQTPIMLEEMRGGVPHSSQPAAPSFCRNELIMENGAKSNRYRVQQQLAR